MRKKSCKSGILSFIHEKSFGAFKKRTTFAHPKKKWIYGHINQQTNKIKSEEFILHLRGGT